MTGQSRIWVMAKGYAPDEGGMQSYAQGVAEAWARTGAHVTIFTQTSIGPRVVEDGMRIIDIGVGKSAKVPLQFLAAMRTERRRSGAPDFVHATTWRTSLLPMVLRLPFAVTFHGREFMYPRGAALFALRQAVRSARAVIAVSHFSAARLAERIGRRRLVTVAWNGLSAQSTSVSDGSPSWPAGDGRRILSLCRLEPRKNVAATLRACAHAREAGFTFHLVIGGRGPEETRLRALSTELKLDSHVTFAGFVPGSAVAGLYRAAEIFLHPQITNDDGKDFEGFGIAIADAMAAECAVVVGSAGGTPELVDAHSGIVVDGRDQLAVSDALIALMVDHDRCAEMGRAARARADKWFSWDRHVSKIEQALAAPS